MSKVMFRYRRKIEIELRLNNSERQRRQTGRDQDPPPLEAGPIGSGGEVEAIDLEEAQCGEGGDRSEQEGCGLGCERPHRHVEPAEGDEEDEEGQRGLGIDTPLLSEVDQSDAERRPARTPPRSIAPSVLRVMGSGDDVDDDDADVVVPSGLVCRLDELPSRLVGASIGQGLCDSVWWHHRVEAVGAQQQPVTGVEVEVDRGRRSRTGSGRGSG